MFVILRDVVQKGVVDALPESGIFELIFGACHRIIELKVSIKFVMVIDNMHAFINIVNLRGKKVIFCSFCTLPEHY